MKNLLIITLLLLISSCSSNGTDKLAKGDYSNYKLLLTPLEQLTRHDIFTTNVTIYYSDVSKEPSKHGLVVQTFGGHSFFNIPEGAVKIEASVFFEDGKRVKIELINTEGTTVEELTITQQPYIYISEI